MKSSALFVTANNASWPIVSTLGELFMIVLILFIGNCNCFFVTDISSIIKFLNNLKANVKVVLSTTKKLASTLKLKAYIKKNTWEPTQNKLTIRDTFQQNYSLQANNTTSVELPPKYSILFK